EVRKSVDFARLENRHDVRMLQARHRQYLATEALGRHSRCQLRRKNLDDDLAIEVVIFAHEHERHPTTSELALNGVRSAKCGKETIGYRGHERNGVLRCQQLLDNREGRKVGTNYLDR